MPSARKFPRKLEVDWRTRLDTMSLPYLLQYRLHQDAPEEWRDKWNELQKECHGHGLNSGKRKRYEEMATAYILPWLDRLRHHQLPSEDLVVLKRCEGGIGGNSNKTDRQIRFDHNLGWTDDDIIRLMPIPSDDKLKVFTLSELKVFGTCFQGVLQEKMAEAVYQPWKLEEECIHFQIVLDM